MSAPATRALTASELTPGMLAQFRGCTPDNECYSDCEDAARSTIDDPGEDAAEVEQARAWASKRRWQPDPRQKEASA
jgi:hypothetical protein